MASSGYNRQNNNASHRAVKYALFLTRKVVIGRTEKDVPTKILSFYLLLTDLQYLFVLYQLMKQDLFLQNNSEITVNVSIIFSLCSLFVILLNLLTKRARDITVLENTSPFCHDTSRLLAWRGYQGLLTLQNTNPMNIDTSLFFRALGLAIVLEGLFWAVAPKIMRRVMTQALEKNNEELRNMGVIAILSGLILIWLLGS